MINVQMLGIVRIQDNILGKKFQPQLRICSMIPPTCRLCVTLFLPKSFVTTLQNLEVSVY